MNITETMLREVSNSNTIKSSATILLNGKISDVFPLFGPLREMDWADGWSPVLVTSSLDVHDKMIFRTPAKFKDEVCYMWIVSTYRPSQNFIEYTVSSVGRVWFITVSCFSNEELTSATITYEYHAVDEHAYAKNLESMNNIFADNLQDWQKAINHFLSTGVKLKS